MKQFQCEVTGKSGLDYFEALQSEKQEARIMHARFPAPLKPVILQAVQWRAYSTSSLPAPWHDAHLTMYPASLSHRNHGSSRPPCRGRVRPLRGPLLQGRECVLHLDCLFALLKTTISTEIFVDVKGQKCVYHPFSTLLFLSILSTDSLPMSLRSTHRV